MKIILLINFFLFSSIISFSQNSLTIGPEICFGSNSFKSNGGIGLGGSVELIVKTSVKNAVRFYSGYDFFHYYKKQYQNSGFVPARIGYQHFFKNDCMNIFADAGIGKFFNTNYSTVFSFGLGISYRLKLNSSHFFQLSPIYNFNYNKAANTAWVAVRIAYGLSLKKSIMQQ